MTRQAHTTQEQKPWQVGVRRCRPLAAAVALTFSAVLPIAPADGASAAGGSITYLGKPTAAVSSLAYFPLSGFHRIGAATRQAGRVQLLFLGTVADDASAVERWPVVKALDQFGAFSRVGQYNGPCATARQGPAAGATICQLSTFVWTNARYSSAYVAFNHKDLLDSNNKLLQSMTPSEMALYRKYAEGRGRTKLEQLLYAASDNPTTHRLPLVYVGGYVQTVSQLMNVGVISGPVAAPRGSTASGFLSGLPFDEVRSALVSGKDPQGAEGLNYSVNAEANIITALICHADGGRPHGVCTRPAIRQILKHVK